MHIIYNGISIDVLTLDRFFFDVVMDDSGTDFLYNRVEILCSGIVNGQAEVREVAGPPMSFVATGLINERHREAVKARPADFPIPPAADSVPPTTDGAARKKGVTTDFVEAEAHPFSGRIFPKTFAIDNRLVEALAAGAASPISTLKLIEKRLTDPRGKLFVFSDTAAFPDSELLLQSPGWTEHCDCKNGPKPTHFGITQSFGDARTLFVQFGIETYVHNNRRENLPSYLFLGKDDPLLSNRFRMVHSVDDSSWLTIEVDGTAVFDVGRLHKTTLSPDAYRPNLLLPVPFGFVRSNIEVDGEPDMSAVHYRFVDTQQQVNFPAGPYVKAMHIEALHRQYLLSDTDVLQGALQSYEGVLNRAWLRDSRSPAAKKKRGKRTKLSPVPGIVPPGGTP